MKPQWVCRVCGYNMIGKMPDVCPFCGEPHSVFMSWQEAEATYKVNEVRVNQYVTQLMSVPRLGLEHAAYVVQTRAGPLWVDSPSALNRDLAPVEHIFFTHPDFMGASNQYCELWSSQVHLHCLDSVNPLIEQFPIDDRFESDFVHEELQAFHIGGHTPGFTIYVYDKVLFVCDYAFPPDQSMQLNPYSPAEEIRVRGERIKAIGLQREVETVCGYNYVVDFATWLPHFERALHA